MGYSKREESGGALLAFDGQASPHSSPQVSRASAPQGSPLGSQYRVLGCQLRTPGANDRSLSGKRGQAICLGVWRGHSSVPRRTLPSGLAGTRPCLAVSRDAWFQCVEMATRQWGIYETSQAITWARLQVVVPRDECGGTESREERRFSRFCRAI